MFERHHRAVLALCRHMLGSHQEAEDAVQHAFLAAYRGIREGEQEIRLRPWLFAIARNRCLDILRARRERPLEEAPEPSTEHLSAEVQRRDDLRAMLADVARLPDDQRAALVMAEVGAVSHAEIADVLGVRASRSKGSCTRRARRSPPAATRATRTAATSASSSRPCAAARCAAPRCAATCARAPAARSSARRSAPSGARSACSCPCVPTAGLKAGVLGTGAAAGGAAAAGGGGGSLAAKALVGAALIGGGTVATVEWRQHGGGGRERPAEAATPRPTRTATATATATAETRRRRARVRK